MPCILKALIGWLILLVVSGAVGLFLRQALFGLLVLFPAESTNPAVASTLRDTRRRLKRGHISLAPFSASSSQRRTCGPLPTSGTSLWRLQLLSLWLS
jgi:cytoskeletal protein RodZ